MRIRCITTSKFYNDRAKQMQLDETFHIPDFSTLSDGLTQQQYVSRKITMLDKEIGVARILE
jgi:hypothetical protein